MRIPAKYRKYIYVGACVLLAGSLALGVVDAEQLTTVSESVVKLIGALVALLAAFNVQGDDV